MLIKPENFLKKSKDNVKKYIKHSIGNYEDKLIMWGFIEWNIDEAFVWAPPFEKNGVFCRVTNHSYDYGLNGLATELSSNLDHQTYSYFNLPEKYKALINKIRNSDRDWEKLTYQELLIVRNEMTSEELHEHNELCKNRVKDREVNDFFLTIERPYWVYLCGLDDVSYSCAVATDYEAIDIVKQLIKTPTLETLDKLNFKFTN